MVRMDVPNLSLIRGIRGNGWMSERTNGPRNGSNCGDERNSNKRMKTSPGKKRAHFDNGLVYGNQRYLRGSVGIWWAIAAGSSWKARTLTCVTNWHTRSANNAHVYRFVPVGTFSSLFLTYDSSASYICFRHFIFSHSDKLVLQLGKS